MTHPFFQDRKSHLIMSAPESGTPSLKLGVGVDGASHMCFLECSILGVAPLALKNYRREKLLARHSPNDDEAGTGKSE